jgi:predicted nuclease of predicted toxin-antitoxin system
MTFLANENFPYPSVKMLEQEGYTIFYIAKEFPGISDDEVILKAKKIGAIILTFDKDYGEIIFKSRVDNPPAVIFFRDKGNDPTKAGQMLLDLIRLNEFEWEGRLSVIEETGIRQKIYS